MRDIHLVAYQGAGFRPVALATRTPAHARQAAALRGVPKVHDHWKKLIADPAVEVLDIAFPPDQQLDIIREAVKQKHIRGILAQKPLAEE
jgi:predicted dehydrogenase